MPKKIEGLKEIINAETKKQLKENGLEVVEKIGDYYKVIYENNEVLIHKDQFKLEGLTTVQIIAIILSVVVVLSGGLIFMVTSLSKKKEQNQYYYSYYIICIVNTTTTIHYNFTTPYNTLSKSIFSIL